MDAVMGMLNAGTLLGLERIIRRWQRPRDHIDHKDKT